MGRTQREMGRRQSGIREKVNFIFQKKNPTCVVGQKYIVKPGDFPGIPKPKTPFYVNFYVSQTGLGHGVFQNEAGGSLGEKNP
ncbi:hypothetical protein, partial [Listeria monocytogenes]|uniref:hypothetical protein n=1 Tax=Listeria monocytogenes TaxID=1639 RepID=UPI001C0AD15C